MLANRCGYLKQNLIMSKFKNMQPYNDKKECIKGVKVQFAVHCQCGSRIMNDELVKRFDKYHCPKCDILVTSIGSDK